AKLPYLALHILVIWAGLLYTQKHFSLLYLVILTFLLIISVLWFPRFRQILLANANLMLTMLLGGLWHGAAMRFVIWGALHGLALSLHKLWLQIVAQRFSFFNQSFFIFFSKIITFNFISFTWIFFRANPIVLGEGQSIGELQVAQMILQKIFFDFRWDLTAEIIIAYKSVFILLFIAFFLHLLPMSLKDIWLKIFTKIPDIFKALLIFIWLLFFFYQLRSISTQPFIYFQF
ncbi:MAG: hypothetical protein ACK40K_00370, partial [Raineya sp.]